MAQSDRDVINAAVTQLDQQLDAVPAAIDTLLSVPPPKGDAATVRTIADAFKKAASTVDNTALDLSKTASHQLPSVWVGKAADSAADVVVAAADDLGDAASVFGQAVLIFNNLAQGFDDAHTKHNGAQDDLHRAASACDTADYGTARSLGNEGAQQLLAAIDASDNAATDATRQLTTLTDQARAHQLNTPNLDAADRLVIASSSTPDGPHVDNRILTDAQAQRAAQQLNALDDDDRKRMDQLLAGAQSAQERAYLMKMLAAGHNINDITTFDQLIHDHGNDPQWLEQHLTPFENTPTSPANITYASYSWTQGDQPTCVSSSTLMARAMTDPSYNLWLTTGNKPDDPNSTSADAFHDRLSQEQKSLYDQGRAQDGQTNNGPGMNATEGQNIANADIGKYTGQNYIQHPLNSPQDIRTALPSIEQAVDAGQPVPFQTFGSGNEGHQLVVIGHQGDQLEVYNPWGTVSWVSEDNFINGHMDQLPDGNDQPSQIPPTVTGVLLPQ